MVENENKEYESPKITTTEDKLKLTLKEHKDINNGASKMTTHLGFFISFATVLLTAEFKTVLGINGEVIQAVFICLSLLFGGLFFVSGVKLLRNKLKGTGDEEWFLLRVQGKEKSKSKSLDISGVFDFDFKMLLGIVLRVILYLLPLGIWILVMCLIGWENAWLAMIEDENGSALPAWIVSLVLSGGWLGYTYFMLFAYWGEIQEFFDDRFYY